MSRKHKDEKRSGKYRTVQVKKISKKCKNKHTIIIMIGILHIILFAVGTYIISNI